MSSAARIIHLHRRFRIDAVALVVALASGCGPGPTGREDIEEKSSRLIAKSALLQRWAPIHYQDVNKGGGGKSLGGRADYMIRFDYEPASNAEDHWNSWDKWDNLPGAGNDLGGVMYTEVTESPTHWFLNYMQYHPRDWDSRIAGQDHENDAEGIQLMVRKDGSQFGRLEGMVTIAHSDQWPYTQDIDRVVPRDGGGRLIQWEERGGVARPRTYQEAEGHGVFACGHPDKTKCDKGDEDGIRYVPDGAAQAPGEVGVWTPVSYALRDVDDLWERRHEPLMFDPTKGTFNGNKSGGCGDGLFVTCDTNAASPPWNSRLGTDPAADMNARFEFRGVTPPSDRYFKNDFLGCEDLTLARSSPGHTSASCNPECSGAIVAADPYCGDTAWDAGCVAAIETVCGSQTSN